MIIVSARSQKNSKFERARLRIGQRTDGVLTRHGTERPKNSHRSERFDQRSPRNQVHVEFVPGSTQQFASPCFFPAFFACTVLYRDAMLPRWNHAAVYRERPHCTAVKQSSTLTIRKTDGKNGGRQRKSATTPQNITE